MDDRRLEVAREAARLLYTGAVEEYLQAKEQATASLGVDASPSNFEVAEELDRLAEDAEGPERTRRLREMRETAQRIMEVLYRFQPRLIGSVWRGTVHRGSDIDLVAYADLKLVEEALKGFNIQQRKSVQFKGGIRAYQIQFVEADYTVEVIIRAPEDAGVPEHCDIYGDEKRGLGSTELERLLVTDPYRRFIPRKRTK